MARVLIVEDEVDMNNLIRDHLRAEGHEIAQAFGGKQAIDLVAQQVPDLVILDWMLPDLDGLAVCRRLRAEHVMPIIMLTARGEEMDRVLGLEVGADDYVAKPFSVLELMARARAMLRRVALDSHDQGATDRRSSSIVHGPLTVDRDSMTATISGEPVHLTPKEFELLLLFVESPGRAFSREYILERIWNNDFEGYERAIDTHIRRLRRKLGPLGDCIETVWAVGYRFMPGDNK